MQPNILLNSRTTIHPPVVMGSDAHRALTQSVAHAPTITSSAPPVQLYSSNLSSRLDPSQQLAVNNLLQASGLFSSPTVTITKGGVLQEIKAAQRTSNVSPIIIDLTTKPQESVVSTVIRPASPIRITSVQGAESVVMASPTLIQSSVLQNSTLLQVPKTEYRISSPSNFIELKKVPEVTSYIPTLTTNGGGRVSKVTISQGPSVVEKPLSNGTAPARKESKRFSNHAWDSVGLSMERVSKIAKTSKIEQERRSSASKIGLNGLASNEKRPTFLYQPVAENSKKSTPSVIFQSATFDTKRSNNVRSSNIMEANNLPKAPLDMKLGTSGSRVSKVKKSSFIFENDRLTPVKVTEERIIE